MIGIAILDIIGTVGAIVAVLVIPHISIDLMGKTASRLLTLISFLYLFVMISNVLEHLGITSVLDSWENPVEALFLSFILLFFFSSWLYQETQRRIQTEKSLNELNTVLGSAQQINKLLTEQTKSIEEDFSRAAEIMQTLLPTYAPVISGASVSAIHRPSRHVGGDLYDIVQLDHNNFAFYVADATGHGVSSALLAMLFKSQLKLNGNNGKTEMLKIEQILVNINNILVSHCHGTGMFVTVIWGLFNTKTNTLKIVSAGHPPAILRHYTTNENVTVINVTGSALGLSTNAKYTETTVQLQPGDQLLLYTDGLYCNYENMETVNPVKKIASVLSQCKEHGIKQLYKISEMMHCENDVPDDITMLLLELSPGLSRMENVQHTTAVPENETEPKENHVVIAAGESESGIFLKLQGQVGWTSAVSFHEVCINAITEARDTKLPIIIDFQKCSYLDSTLLGTIYELVDLSEITSITLFLQNVSPKIHGLFQELGMERVIDHLITVPKPLPVHMTLQEITNNTNLSPQRILRAHQTLSAVNVHNQKQFGLLVESLRQEIGNVKRD